MQLRALALDPILGIDVLAIYFRFAVSLTPGFLLH
jgi:hypothetical protein